MFLLKLVASCFSSYISTLSEYYKLYKYYIRQLFHCRRYNSFAFAHRSKRICYKMYSILVAYALCTAILILPVGYVLWLAWSAHNYWRRIDTVQFIPGTPFIGNLAPMLRQKCSAVELYDSMYNDQRTRDAPVVGVNVFMRPALMIRNVELIKKVLVRDFSSFCNRYSASDVHRDLMGSCSLLLQKNPAWQTARSRMTPFFTSANLRQMHRLMGTCGRDLCDVICNRMPCDGDRVVLEVKELFACYATDIIASCAFGVQANSLKNPVSEFRQQGKRIFDHTLWRKLETICVFFLPAAVPIFGCSVSGNMIIDV